MNTTLATVRLMCSCGEWYDSGVGRALQSGTDVPLGRINRYVYSSYELGLANNPNALANLGPSDLPEVVKLLIEQIERMRYAKFARDIVEYDRIRRVVRALAALRNSIYGRMFGRWLPVLALVEFHYYCVEPAVATAEDSAARAIPAREVINRRRIARQGGFSGRDVGEFWGY